MSASDRGVSVSVRSVPSEDSLPGLDGLLSGSPGAPDQFVPGVASTHSLKPPDSPRHLLGTCQTYRGQACARHLRNRTVFVSDTDSQPRMEERLVAALRVIEVSADLSEVRRGAE